MHFEVVAIAGGRSKSLALCRTAWVYVLPEVFGGIRGYVPLLEALTSRGLDVAGIRRRSVPESSFPASAEKLTWRACPLERFQKSRPVVGKSEQRRASTFDRRRGGNSADSFFSDRLSAPDHPVDQIQRTSLHLLVEPADVLAAQPEKQELHAGEEDDPDDQRGEAARRLLEDELRLCAASLWNDGRRGRRDQEKIGADTPLRI